MANPSGHLPDTLQAPQISRTFTTFTADIDLRQQSGCPTHAAQRLLLINNTAGALSAVFAGTDDVDATVSVPTVTAVEINQAVRKIDDTTADTLTSIVAFWWCDGATVFNP